MYESQACSVQRLAFDAEIRMAGAIHGIAHDRVADRRAVHAYLMRAPGLERDTQQRRALRLVAPHATPSTTCVFTRTFRRPATFKCLEHAIMRHRPLAFMAHREARARPRIAR